MEYVSFGNTGRQVSRIGFGGAVLGLKNYLHEYDPLDKKQRGEAIEAIHTALECGINYFDTAPGYGDGESERILGEALEEADYSRLFLATKTGYRGKKGDILRSIEQSLTRLKAPCLDLVQFHGNSYTREEAEAVLAPGGALDELYEAKRQGMIRFAGFTTEDNNAAVYDFIASGRFDMYQLCYNLFFQHPYDPNRPFGSMFEAEKQKMGIAVMRPTTSGLFQKWMAQADPENKRNYTRDLIQFTLSNPLVDVVLIGMRSAKRVRQNVEILEDTAGRIEIDSLYRYYD